MTRMWVLLTFVVVLVFGAIQVVAEPVRLHGLNYNTRKGPDFAWDKCKWKEEIIVDLTMLKRITDRIRILSLTDCGQGEQVLEVARDLGLKVWLGMWVGQEEWVFENEKGALADLLSKGLIDDDTVLGVTVGSEALYREDATLAQLIDYKTQVRNILNNNGLSQLPVSITEIAPNYSAHPSLRSEVDVVYTNIFPFWENIGINEALDDLNTDIEWIKSLPETQNKEIILGETGWPSDGFIEGVGEASEENQVQYFVDFYCRMDKELNWKYYWFTAIDNSWRQIQDPENTIEGNWGFMKSDLTLKPLFENLSFTCSNGIEYSFGEIDWTIPIVTAAPASVPAESCQAHSLCAGIFGDCCPTPDGIHLACCNASPTDPPIATPMPSKSPILPTTASPTTSPTKAPSKQPITASPTKAPSKQPITASPTKAPSKQPITASPTAAPVSVPPTLSPVTSPPTASPVSPTLFPSKRPTVIPTKTPTVIPATPPTTSPTLVPSAAPDGNPSKESYTYMPSNKPINWPSAPSEFNGATSNSGRSSILPSFLLLIGTVWLMGFTS